MESLWRMETGDIAAGKNGKGELRSVHRDVVVVGAGMAGLLTAYLLKEQGLNVLVLEAGKIASGQTEKTTAKITSQHDLKYAKLIKQIGLKKAAMYAYGNQLAIEEYDRLVREKGIDCNFERTTAYLYSLEDEKALKAEAEAAKKLGIDAFFTKETELPFPVRAAVGFKNQAQFSPLKFLRYIAGELEIWENTPVLKIDRGGVITKDLLIWADRIVVATHYPIKNVPGFYFLRQHQERSYVLALSGCEELKGMYIGVDENGLSLRQSQDVLLLGGAGHRTGKKECAGAYNYLATEARKLYPNCREVTRWSAQDAMPHDGIPFIGKFSIFTPNIYIATGFQKWGMTSSMVAAMIIRDDICQMENSYKKVFSPQRMNIVAGIGKLLVDIGVSAKGLTLGWFGKRERRCPHLGCRLNWNPNESTWDCPCHGSRFSEGGELIDDPAKRDKFTASP